ncbi:MAG TPA: hypothetical protein VGM30_09385 [Puia sp.]|jgi:hypothetical protein
MNTYAGRRRSFLLAVLLLLLSILLEQYWLVRLFPWLSGLGSIRPMVVFLDIPLEGPSIDPVPVGILFSFFYSIVIAPGISRTGGSIGPALRKKVRAVLMGLSALLMCVLTGGGLFYLLQDMLPRTVRNGIDSFGVRADVYLPYPGEDRIHLRGSMVLLVCCYAGIRIWMWMMEEKPAAVIPAVAPAGVREGKRISMQIPEPVLVTDEQPLPAEKRARVLRPEAGMGRGRMYPCIVDTEMVRPART